MNIAKELGVGPTRSLQMGMARHAEMQISGLAEDIKTLTQWLRRDVLALAGPCLATRIELFDFVTAELLAREHLEHKRIRPVRIALQNQRDDLLAFAGVIDDKLEAIAQTHNLSMCLVRQACVPHRKPSTSPLYWQGCNGLRAQMGAKFHAVFEAVEQATWRKHHAVVRWLKTSILGYATISRYVVSSAAST